MCAQLHSHCGFSAGGGGEMMITSFRSVESVLYACKPPLPSEHGEHFSRQNSKSGNPRKTEEVSTSLL